MTWTDVYVCAASSGAPIQKEVRRSRADAAEQVLRAGERQAGRKCYLFGIKQTSLYLCDQEPPPPFVTYLLLQGHSEASNGSHPDESSSNLEDALIRLEEEQQR